MEFLSWFQFCFNLRNFEIVTSWALFFFFEFVGVWILDDWNYYDWKRLEKLLLEKEVKNEFLILKKILKKKLFVNLLRPKNKWKLIKNENVDFDFELYEGRSFVSSDFVSNFRLFRFCVH